MVGWVDARDDLVVALRSARGRPGLIVGGAAGSQVVAALTIAADRRVSLGRQLVGHDRLPPLDGLVRAADELTLLTEIEVLFSPQVGLDVVEYLRRLARSAPVVALWPGALSGQRLTYSLPGRADHVDVVARDVVLLHPVDTTFPDEVPFRMEIVA